VRRQSEAATALYIKILNQKRCSTTLATPYSAACFAGSIVIGCLILGLTYAPGFMLSPAPQARPIR